MRRGLLSFLLVVTELAIPLQSFQTQIYGLTARQLDLTWLLASFLGQRHLGKARIYVYTVVTLGKPKATPLGPQHITLTVFKLELNLSNSLSCSHCLDQKGNKGLHFFKGERCS